MDNAWSATRVRTFQECRRKYYYRYHLAPLGRMPDASAEAKQAHRVKDLVGLEAWAGELVHEIIGKVLNRWRAGYACREDEVVALANQLLSRGFRASHDYWDAHPDEFPRRPALLDLHYYGDRALSRDKAGALKELVTGSLRSFLRSDLAVRIRGAGPRNWLPIDRNAAARLTSGLLVLVKPDFAFREGDKLHIVDWKTGKTEPFWEEVQVVCYALYAAEKWSHQLRDVVPNVVHLHPEFRLSTWDYSPERIDELLGYVAETHDEIVASAEPGASEDHFPVTTECRSCRWCQFRGFCEGAPRQAGEPAAV
jgi:CRISPR/Cas system-associated exonuclease Cas4 (RecB family)